MDIIDDNEPLTITVNQAGFENFSTYTYPTPNPYLTISPDVYSTTATNMPREAISYFQKNVNIGTGNFTLEFDITPTQLQNFPYPPGDNSGGNLAMLLEPDITSTNQAAAQLAHNGIIFTAREYTDLSGNMLYAFHFRSRTASGAGGPNPGDMDWLDWYGVEIGKTYHIIITRTGTGADALSCSITENGVHKTTLVINDGGTVINYFVPMCGRGDSSEPGRLLESSGTISNLLLTYDEQPLYENLSEYTHHEAAGEGPFLTLPNIHGLQATLMPFSATCYLQKPMGIGQGDFLLRFSINAQDLEYNPDPGTSGQAGGYLGVYLTHSITTTNLVAAAYTVPRDGLGFSFRSWTKTDLSQEFLMRVTSYTDAPTANGNWGEFNLTYSGLPGENTVYDIELERTGNWAELRIYSHQSGALLGTIHPRDTTTYQPVQDFTDIQYFCPIWARGAASGGDWKATAYGENYQFL